MSLSHGNGLTVVLGPPNSGKRGVVLGWWEERLDRRPVVVVPTVPDARDMSAEMVRRVGGLVGQTAAVTFSGLAELLLGRPGRYVQDFQRMLLVAKLLRYTRLKGLCTSTHLPGVTSVLADLLVELDESGRSSRDIEGILRRWKAAEPVSAALADDIGRIHVGYQQAMARLGLTERAAAIREAAEGAKTWQRPVALCGFSSFTRDQRDLVWQLSRRAEVLVTLTHERERGVGLAAPEEVDWWSERASLCVDVSPRERAYASSAIAFLERSLLGDEPPPPFPPAQGENEGVLFLLASGRRAEAELAAERIHNLIRAGFAPAGIAVVVRQVETWGRLLEDVFSSCGIRCQVDDRLRLKETGLGHGFLEALRGIAFDDAEAVLTYLRGPYSAVAVEEACELEMRYRQGVGRGAGALQALATGGAADALRAVRAAVAASSGDAKPGSVESELDLTAAEALAEKMLLAGARGATAGERDLETDARAFRALRSALAAMSAVAAANEAVGTPGRHGVKATTAAMPECAPGVSGDAARTELKTALRVLGQVGVASGNTTDPQSVQVLSAQRARARRFEAVFILGLVEGEFPGDLDPPSLLSAAQRSCLDHIAGGLFAPGDVDETVLFIGAASRAWRLLYLSARDAEDDGVEVLPSRFWEKARTLLGAEVERRHRRTLSDQVYSLESSPSPRHYLRACAAGGSKPIAGAESSGAVRNVPAWHRAPTQLASPRVRAELAGYDRFSPSALEAYARCPFAWFVERVVGREEVEPELDERMLGELVHDALAGCYRLLARKGLLPLAETDLPQAERQVGMQIDDLVRGPGCVGSQAERRVAAWRLKVMARRLLRNEAAAGGGLVFAEAEKRIGGDQGVEVDGLRIRGRVDRLDSTMDGGRLFIVDYKSGAGPSAAALGTAEGLQLPLYLRALAAERTEVEVIGGAYVSLSTGTLTGVVAEGCEGLVGSRRGTVKVMGQDGWEQLLGRALEVAGAAAAGIREGVIGPRVGVDCPHWCALGPACRSKRGGYRP